MCCGGVLMWVVGLGGGSGLVLAKVWSRSDMGLDWVRCGSGCVGLCVCVLVWMVGLGGWVWVVGSGLVLVWVWVWHGSGLGLAWVWVCGVVCVCGGGVAHVC